MQPIETTYQGYKFRSRLEARWAVFFDALGIKWEYEAEGYQLSNGELYLPDFWLPTFSGGMFAEVKPEGGDFSKARQLCQDTHKMVWLCEGLPDIKEYEIYCHDGHMVDKKLDELLGGDDVYVMHGIPNSDQASGEDRMFWEAGYDPKEELGCLPNQYIKAVEMAKQARFEFGENQ